MAKQKLYSFSALLVCLAALACGAGASSCMERTRNPETADSLLLFTGNSEYYYKLREPHKSYLLPPELNEVSALSYWQQGQLLMVDDEKGKLFTYDLSREEVVHQFQFTGSGDFEGVEAVKDHIYALRSDGKLYKMKYTSGDSAAAEEINTPLTSQNNTEGLGYDPQREMLLIACKDAAGYKGHETTGRAVYGFDVAEGEMMKKDVFNINKTGLKSYYERVKEMDYEAGRFRFGPSAIARHPVEDTFYLLAHKGRLLLVLNRSGEIIGSYPVPQNILPQAEGICFSPEGDLYISSETGGGMAARVVHFKPQQR